MTETQALFETLLQNIAAKNLGIVTLETRNDDFLDFHELAVWQVKDALHEAFLAGVNAGMTL